MESKIGYSQFRSLVDAVGEDALLDAVLNSIEPNSGPVGQSADDTVQGCFGVLVGLAMSGLVLFGVWKLLAYLGSGTVSWFQWLRSHF